jgi:hypothetical protein
LTGLDKSVLQLRVRSNTPELVLGDRYLVYATIGGGGEAYWPIYNSEASEEKGAREIAIAVPPWDRKNLGEKLGAAAQCFTRRRGKV